MKTCLILGAGASKASNCALPTMKGFFADGLSNKPELAEFLTRFYGGAEPSEYNLEEVLAYLDISRHREALWGYAPRVQAHSTEERYHDVLDLVRSRLAIPPGTWCLKHERLLSRLSLESSILTLNYDNVVEESVLCGANNSVDAKERIQRVNKLAQLIGQPMFFGGGDPPTLIESEKREGLFLKLHGSLDWLICESPGCGNGTRIYSTRLEELGEGMGPGNPCRRCGAPLAMMIVPPVATKRIEDRGRLAFLWRLAIHELASAGSWTIIGLSLAPSDLEVRWLFRAAIEARTTGPLAIELVDPDGGARQRFADLIPLSARGPVKQFAGLDEYLAGQECIP